MQIPSSAIAASVSAVASNTKADRPAAPDAATNTPLQVEKSGESSADRDAQGQGDGLGQRGNRQKSQSTGAEQQLNRLDASIPAPTLPDEPPSQLDLIG